MDTVTLWLCTDCTMYAHGFPEGETGREYPAATVAAMESGNYPMGSLTPGGLDTHTGPCISEEDGNAYPTDDCECDQITFTWNRCDVCLTNLGGSREAFTLWYTNDDNNKDTNKGNN